MQTNSGGSMVRISAAAAVWMGASLLAQGAERPVVLDPVVVTARGHAAPSSATPGGIGVIGSEEIDARPVPGISDLAPLVPGVARAADGAWGADLAIRGLSREAVVLLIDGIRLQSGTDIGARFGMIDPSSIERIEILKGPVSALYGSGAMGGVVNVLTAGPRYPDRPETRGRASLSAESNPRGWRTHARGEYADERFFVSAGQGVRDRDDYKDGDGRTVRNTRFEDRDTSLSAGWKLNEEHRVEGRFQHYDGREIGIPGSGTAPLPAAADVAYPMIRRRLLQVTSLFTPPGSRFEESRLTLYRHENTRRVRIDRFPPASPVEELRPGADHETSGAQWMGRLVLGDQTLVAGAEGWERTMDSFRERRLRNGAVLREEPLPYVTYRSAGVFLENTWPAGSATLNAGGRMDLVRVRNDANAQWDESVTEEQGWNAHVGAGLPLSEAWTAKAVAARGYRAAALEERFKYLNLGGGKEVWGDPGLDPEASLFFEAGLHWQGERAFAEWSVFHNGLDNLIAERVVSAQSNVMANIREAEIYGMEARGSCRLGGGWEGYANAAWTHGRDKTAGEPLPGIPPVSGLVGLRYQAPRGWWGSLETVGALRQSRTPSGVAETAGWVTCDLTVGRRVSTAAAGHHFYVGARNLLDRTYRDHLSSARGTPFNEPGRSLLAGYEARF